MVALSLLANGSFSIMFANESAAEEIRDRIVFSETQSDGSVGLKSAMIVRTLSKMPTIMGLPCRKFSLCKHNAYQWIVSAIIAQISIGG